MTLKITPKQYLHSIKPTSTGKLVLASMIFLLPMLLDLIILIACGEVVREFSITVFMTVHYAEIFICLLVYHIGYFLAKNIYQNFF
jgi:hypothetical protein